MSKYRIVKKSNTDRDIYSLCYKYRYYVQTKFLGIWWTNDWWYSYEQALDAVPIKPKVCEVVWESEE